MTKGLIERERMQQSLNLAKEVQQNPLPKSNLKVMGLLFQFSFTLCILMMYESH